MMKKILLVILLTFTLLTIAAIPLYVTNFNSVHIDKFPQGGTATPRFMVDNLNGPAVIAEFRDNKTPVARIPNGGGLDIISGTLTMSGDTTVNGNLIYGLQSETVTTTFTITPTSPYIALSSVAPVTSSTTLGIITASLVSGHMIVLHNTNAADAIVIDGTGGTVECGSDISLGANDMVTLIYNLSNKFWACQSFRDN